MSSESTTAHALRQLGNIHHAAYRCRDAAQTRRFYEELLGLPLAIALVFDHVSGTEEKREYMHLFFRLGDGTFLAFFDDPGHASPEHFERKDGFDQHIALEAESLEAMQAWQQRIRDAGKTCMGPIDHGFVHSVYMYDPNGIQLEITARVPQYDTILAHEGEMVEQMISEWTARTRERKEQVFGVADLERR